MATMVSREAVPKEYQLSLHSSFKGLSLTKYASRQPYNLHIKGPYIQIPPAKAFMVHGGPWQVIMHMSEKAKFTINKLVCWKMI